MFNLCDFSFNNPLDKIDIGTPVNIRCIPKRQLHYNEESGFGAFIVEDQNEEEFKISGLFVAPPTFGQTYQVKGKVIEYREEKQVRVDTMLHSKPINKKGIIEYLKTLKGLKTRAELIYNEFGEDSIDILINEPLKVSNAIRGIGKKNVTDWSEQLEKLSESQEAVATLLGYGISVNEARKLYKIYGDNIVIKIETNPFFLAREVEGYGFEKCDKIARLIGTNPRDEERIKEGVIHTLKKQAVSFGHCYLPLYELLYKSKKVLEIKLTYLEMIKLSKEFRGQQTFKYTLGKKEYEFSYVELINALAKYKSESNIEKRENLRFKIISFDNDESNEIEEQVFSLIEENRLVGHDGNVYLSNLYFDEIQVAERVKALTKYDKAHKRKEVEAILNNVLKEKGIILEDKQREACIEFNICDNGMYILNGSAGTGKTFTLKIILEVAKRLMTLKNEEILLFAPTGKASKVAQKSTGMECKTIHRGLEYVPCLGFNYNEFNPLEAKVVICDESSMLDITLTKDFLNAIKNNSKVIFMGDIKQLPSIGAGNVLKDLINSKTVKMVTLNVVKRQGLLSGVIRNANNVIDGKMLETYTDTKDAYFLRRESSGAILSTIIECMHRVLKFNGYSLDDVQILSPQRKGTLGTYYLNYLIQKEFNPENEDTKILAKKFEVRTKENSYNEETIELFFKKGDKVIHIRNNYEIKWYNKTDDGQYVQNIAIMGITNGECGVIEDIIIQKEISGSITQTMIVKYESGYVKYVNSFIEIEHAYALTIHKSQGSSWKAVLMPISSAHKKMLSNNILYTGVSRAEEFLCVVGESHAVSHAIDNHDVTNRYTGLEKRIA